MSCISVVGPRNHDGGGGEKKGCVSKPVTFLTLGSPH